MASHDVYEPILRVRASGFGGSGYKLPTVLENGAPVVVPGVTTVLGALDKPGVVQWAVDNTAAYAVASIDQLLTRSEQQGFGFLRWYHRRTPDFDDGTVDLTDYSNGVLNDLAELGTLVHDWIADHVTGKFEPELVRSEQTAMIEAFLDWLGGHFIEPVSTEATVFDPDLKYAGTLDHIWDISCLHDGECVPGASKKPVRVLVDVKTSRKVHDTHIAQLAALGNASKMYIQGDTGTEYTTKKWGTTYWNEEDMVPVEEYAILQVRPDDTDKEGRRIPAFCAMHHIPKVEISAGYNIFTGALRVRHGEAQLKQARKHGTKSN